MNRSTRVCCHCGKSENLLTRAEYEDVIDESDLLGEMYRNPQRELFQPMSETDSICWNCAWDEIEGILCDGIDHSEEIEIRKQYKQEWASDGQGQLYPILTRALEYSCFKCGNAPGRKLDYDSLSEAEKKRARKILHDYHATLKEAERTINLCFSCSL